MSESRQVMVALLFGPFRLNIQDRILEREGQRVHLTPKVIDTLFVLIENAPQVVTKETLMQTVWPDVTVVESGLTRNISALRKALEQGVDEGAYIETIPRRGYRFVAEVREERAPTQPEAIPPPIAVVAEEISADTPRVAIAPEPAVATPGKRMWPVAVLVAAVLSAMGAFWFFPSQYARTAAPADPAVRIGEHLMYKLAPQETLRASEHFQRAISTNPKSAAAHAGYAISLMYMAGLGVRTMTEVLPLAASSAEAAVQLDDELGAAHYALGSVAMFKNWDLRSADREYRRALQLSPESVEFRLGYAQLKLAYLDTEGARTLVEQALNLDPASPALGVQLCRVYYYMRQYRRAEAECKQVLDREPHYALAHYYLALSLGWLDRFDEARENLVSSGLAPATIEVDDAWLRARQGDQQPARRLLDARRELVRRGEVDAGVKLLLACTTGNREEAWEAVKAGVESRSPEILHVHVDPRLELVRSHPEYGTYLSRLGIPRR